MGDSHFSLNDHLGSTGEVMYLECSSSCSILGYYHAYIYHLSLLDLDESYQLFKIKDITTTLL